MFVIRKNLSQADGAPPGTRYDETTGEVQTTPDGGATWNDDPSADPRKNTAYQLPPNPDGNCAAAAGMIVQMKDFKERVFLGTTLVGTATAILTGMVFLIPGIGWLWGLALALGSGVLVAGGTTLYTAFTPAVWDDILCILFCNMSQEGVVNEAQLAEIQEQITAACGATVGTGVQLMFEAWGAVGLTNAGVLNADPEADCSDCNCSWSVTWSVALGNMQEWFPTLYLAQYGCGYFTGSGWRGAITQTPGSVGAMFLGIARQMIYDPSTVIGGVSVKYNGNRSNGNIYSGRFRTVNAAGAVGQSTNGFQWATGSNLTWQPPGFAMSTSASYPFAELFFNNNASVGSDLFEALEITIAGSGFNPFQ